MFRTFPHTGFPRPVDSRWSARVARRRRSGDLLARAGWLFAAMATIAGALLLGSGPAGPARAEPASAPAQAPALGPGTPAAAVEGSGLDPSPAPAAGPLPSAA